MNNTCPSCGAIYNVASKDVGRRIRCKKCSTALMVTDAGLEVEGAGGAAPAPAARPQSAPVEDDFDDEEEVSPRRSGRNARKPAKGGGIDVMQIFKDFGGVPTLLFGFGAFLVIVFLFMPIIGVAGTERAAAGKEKLEQERDTKIKRLVPKGKRLEDLTSDERKKYDEDAEKIRKDYEKQISDAEDDARAERVSNKRSRWFEMYGMMFGFLFLMAGSIGYMTPGQTTVRRILGTVVLGAQMLIIFMVFAAGGGCGGKGGPIPG